MNKICEIICGTAIWIFIIFVFCILLSGCSRKTPVDNAFTDVQQSIVGIKDTLPKECQTPDVLQKIEKVELRAQIAENTCNTEIKSIQVKYERVLWLLGLGIFVFFIRFFVKK